jgi:hypothetical protein
LITEILKSPVASFTFAAAFEIASTEGVINSPFKFFTEATESLF